jgi:hypothetical protein
VTTKCQLCGALIEGKYFPADGSPQQLLRAYDSLSAHMWLHISDHHREQMEEGMLVQRRAAKMYAMNWADHSEAMIPIKQDWRQHMLIAMSVTTRREDDMPAADQTAAGSPDAKAKNSERNTSS